MSKAEFTREKIDERMLGERLRDVRRTYHVSLMELARQTRIQRKYLEALEGGHYDDLPAEVYIRGFIHAYESYFHLEQDTLTGIFEREYQVFQNMHGTSDEEKESGQSVGNFWSRFIGITLTRRHVFVMASLISIAGVGLYIVRGVQTYTEVPYLDVTQPVSGQVVQSAVVSVEGSAKPDTILSVNGEPVALDADGSFISEVGLSQGENTIIITSKSNANKENTRQITVFSENIPQQTEGQDQDQQRGVDQQKEEVIEESDADVETRDTVTQTEEEVEISKQDEAEETEKPVSNVTVAISVVESPTWVTITIDDEEVLRQTLESGEEREFIGEKEIAVSASPGNTLEITHNGIEVGLLSEDEAMVREKIYLPEANLDNTTNGN